MRHLNLVALMLVCWMSASPGFAQNGGNQGGGNQGGGNGGQGQFPGGILINPSGLIDRAVVPQGGGVSLQKQLKNAAQQNLASDLNQPSDLRKISLRQLELEIVRQLGEGRSLSPDVRFLAGLTRIDFVFFIDEGHDVIIAGPAEGFAPLNSGRFVGVETGRPVLCLDDFLIALRGVADQTAVGCSIDPDPQKLATSQQWLKQNASPATVDVARARLERMVQLQGAWNITTFGVPEDSRLCLAMIEADYLMKRIAIGVDNPGIKGLKSSLALAGPGDNMMRRWWFAPHYKTLERNADGTAFQMSGPRLQLFAQEELMEENGNLIDADFSQASSEKFAKLFNARLDELARRVAAFADLQNIFDVLTAVAIVHDGQSKGTVSWKPDVLLDAEQLPTTAYSAAKETSPMLNVKMSGGSLIIGAFSGGVTFRPAQVVRQFTVTSNPETSPKLASPKSPAESNDRWWWD